MSLLYYFGQVVPGELTIVTGVPNSGKSEWIDALLCNINESVGWKFALCSMENRVRFYVHLSTVLSTLNQKKKKLFFQRYSVWEGKIIQIYQIPRMSD